MSGGTDRQRSVFTFAPGAPFAKSLAQLLLDETAGDPETLARYKVLLPTRRACRTVRESFLRLSGGAPILLPALLPIGDVDEGDLSLQMFGADGRFLNIPPAMPALRRQLLLAKMLQAGGVFAEGREQALRLADSLGTFLDEMIIGGKDFSALSRLVPEEFSAHWQISLRFLEILSVHWPKIIEESGMIDAVHRRNLLLRALADYWRAFPPDGPVIAAGTTGSIPATAQLLRVISELPQGRLILPGLDFDLDAESWESLDESHPQYLMKVLLMTLDVSREAVGVIGQIPETAGTGRNDLIREIMRPAATSGQWIHFGDSVRRLGTAASLLDGLRLYTCDTPQEEAQVVALLMREALEADGKTVCLITPDRGLARRVAAHCLRWGIAVNDSAGESLSATSVGIFLFLVLEAAHRRFDPAALLALLKHPLCGLGTERAEMERAVGSLERFFFRDEEHRPHALHDLANITSKSSYKDVARIAQILSDIFAPLTAFSDGQSYDFAKIYEAHIRAAERLSDLPDLPGDLRLWSGEAGEAAAHFLSELLGESEQIDPLSFADYVSLLFVLAQRVTVRPRYGLHPRLSILGQLEARLVDADLVILGGLNEGTWPTALRHDPWLSLPMRKSLGLPGPERFAGQAAHDFAQAFWGTEVVLTRSRKVDGAPTVPSRWLQKMGAVLQACGADHSVLSGGSHLRWARIMDDAVDVRPVSRPCPRPPVFLRPSRVSVTRVDGWLSDPYGHYARYGLGLKKLPPLRVESDHALRGQILHRAFETFLGAYPEILPPDADGLFLGHLQKAAAALLHETETLQFWITRMDDPVRRIMAHERIWRETSKFLATEAFGSLILDVGGQPFTLYGRADRIDRRSDGYALIDYKSGGSFSSQKLQNGGLPQLPLEALILERGSFRRSDPGLQGSETFRGRSSYLGYWMVNAGRKEEFTAAVEGDLTALITLVEDGLKGLVVHYRNEKVAYVNLPDPRRMPRYNDYLHLARVREWSVADSDAEEVIL
ncbi:MAG: double-strand break repair protein AddB [Alphaproteobacteria bacterium]|nr:double-strand break repair protein AddB [Alphaproteobacteria bacterium]QQS57308.1 MAG: double-strand break repair protein AddB [Alphaproteobacteria bacterium]